MAKRGRKSKYTDPIREKILQLLKDGKTEDEVAAITGISRRTLANWKGSYPDLLYAINESKLAADELVEMSLFRKATGYTHPETKVFIHEGCPITEEVEKHYPPDTVAIQFWLRNRQPKKWREKTESDVVVNNTNNINELTDEQLNERIKAFLEKSQGEPKE